jgi:transketolase
MQDLKGYGSWDSHLESHPDSRSTPGIEISGGSLGQIPGVAVGRALAMRRKGPEHADRMVYVLVGDGECQEGSVWEAFMAAAQYRLDNLVVMVDCNKVQAKGFVAEDMNIGPLDQKLRAFGFDVSEAGNGHDVSELIGAFNALRHKRGGRPLGLIVNTVKGKKISGCQHNPNWHTSAPRSVDQARAWLVELWEQDGKRLGIPEEFPRRLADEIEIVPPSHGNPDNMVEKQA